MRQRFHLFKASLRVIVTLYCKLIFKDFRNYLDFDSLFSWNKIWPKKVSFKMPYLSRGWGFRPNETSSNSNGKVVFDHAPNHMCFVSKSELRSRGYYPTHKTVTPQFHVTPDLHLYTLLVYKLLGDRWHAVFHSYFTINPNSINTAEYLVCLFNSNME